MNERTTIIKLTGRRRAIEIYFLKAGKGREWEKIKLKNGKNEQHRRAITNSENKKCGKYIDMIFFAPSGAGNGRKVAIIKQRKQKQKQREKSEQMQ